METGGIGGYLDSEDVSHSRQEYSTESREQVVSEESLMLWERYLNLMSRFRTGRITYNSMAGANLVKAPAGYENTASMFVSRSAVFSR